MKRNSFRGGVPKGDETLSVPFEVRSGNLKSANWLFRSKAPESSLPGLFFPPPVGDLWRILAVLAPVASGVEAGINHLLAQGSGARLQPRYPVEHVNDEVKPVEVVEHHHVKGGGRGSLLLVSPDVEVVVVPPAIGQTVDERRVAVIREDHR